MTLSYLFCVFGATIAYSMLVNLMGIHAHIARSKGITFERLKQINRKYDICIFRRADPCQSVRLIRSHCISYQINHRRNAIYSEAIYVEIKWEWFILCGWFIATPPKLGKWLVPIIAYRILGPEHSWPITNMHTTPIKIIIFHVSYYTWEGAHLQGLWSKVWTIICVQRNIKDT